MLQKSCHRIKLNATHLKPPDTKIFSAKKKNIGICVPQRRLLLDNMTELYYLVRVFKIQQLSITMVVEELQNTPQSEIPFAYLLLPVHAQNLIFSLLLQNREHQSTKQKSFVLVYRLLLSFFPGCINELSTRDISNFWSL